MQRIAYLGPSGTFSEMALARLEHDGWLPLPASRAERSSAQDRAAVPLTAPDHTPAPQAVRAMATARAPGMTATAGAGPVDRIAAPTQTAALELVRDGAVAGAVVPIESSVEGSVAITLDALASGSRLQIVAETELGIRFTIVTRPGTHATDISQVAAYPIAAAQVREWLSRELPSATVLPASSNAAAAEDVRAGRADAAVSTQLAADRLGLAAFASGVADHAGAVTRFVLVTRPCVAPARTGSDRTSMVLALANEPGSLTRAFNEFAVRGIDLSRIESRPTRAGMGTYHFYLDCIGHIDDSAVAEALKALYRTAGVRYLGSWPVATTGGSAPPADGKAAEWLGQLRRGEQTHDN